MELGSETPAPQQAAAPQRAAPAIPEAPAFAMPEPEPAVADPALPAPEMPSPEMPSPVLPGPEMPGPLARGDGGNDGLSSAEIGEIQALLSRLDLDPGSEQGSLTPATAAAIRSYQEMAGLPADGKADRALLDELRSVAELYGS
jgi:hypothetical protein